MKTDRWAGLERAVPMMFMVSAILFFFAFLFNLIIPGLPPGTKEGAQWTVWFCVIFGTGFLVAAIILFPRWAKSIFRKKP
ncbi:MAG: hypothetical protein HYX86_00720 [Chloroflexi bacterium]|nr:hypothetical protein [Chloroflexota bacterium]